MKGFKNLISCSESEGGNFDPAPIMGIQLNDGPIVKFNQENLRQIVNGNADVLEDVANKKFYRAIKKYNRDKENEAKK